MAVSATTAKCVVQEDPKQTFSEWARRIRESDRAAYEAVFRAMSVKLVRYAQTIIRDEASAYDVLQDVFLKLWEIRQKLNPDSSLQALLYTMTRNASLNMRRKKSYLVHSEQFAEDIPVGMDRDDAEKIDVALDARELSGWIQRWIEELPGRRKEAFLLSRRHDLSHREISEIMGLSERTVNTHIFLALKHLRKRLDTLHNDTSIP